MAAEPKNDIKGSTMPTDTEIKKTKKKKGVLSRLWGAVFRLHGDDFEKRLQYIFKEEASILSRITRRSNSWQRITRHLILISVLLEAIAVGYAIMTTRSLHLNWKMRALRVLPVFLLPVLSSVTYFALRRITRMFDRKDHKTLENLRAERQAKIDELKDKTNYYMTQQLIQRYDPDPAAKAAAATVLASKLGADSGLKVYLGDDTKNNAPSGMSNDVELAGTSGLRNRRQTVSNINTPQNASTLHSEDEMSEHGEFEGFEMSQQHQMIVEHRSEAGSSTHDGGWMARLAALLVGEDPEQSYALICGNCCMHNGLARKEDFPHVTYYCPHCNALNRPRQSEHVSGLDSPTGASSVVEDVVSSAGGLVNDKITESNSPVAPAVEDS